jgi:hypothetical protein
MGMIGTALREIAFAIGVVVVAIVAGNVLYRLAADLVSAPGLDRSADAAQGAGMLFAFVVLLVHLAIRVVRYRRRIGRKAV